MAWYEDAFSHDYLRIYSHRSADEATVAVRDLLQLVPVSPQASCLDLACGYGRHIHALSTHGIDAIGLDLSPVLLAHGQATFGLQRLVRGDMRLLPFATSFDFVFSFFSSFGYFAHDDNLAVLHEVERVLNRGGRFVLDYLNPAWIKANLVPHDEQEFPDFVLSQTRRINGLENTVEKDLVITDAAGTRCYSERVKLYEHKELAQMFATAGLTIDHVYGGFDGTPFDLSSPRMLMLGRKV